MLRHDRVVVPRGDTRLLAGDEVLVLVTDESIDGVREILTEAAPRPSGNGDTPGPASAPATADLPAAEADPLDPEPADGAGTEPADGGA